MYDNETTVRFSNIEEVHEFVNAASKCNFDIDLKYNRILVDAKSLLGVLGIGMQNKVQVCCMGEDETFQAVIGKFAIA